MFVNPIMQVVAGLIISESVQFSGRAGLPVVGKNMKHSSKQRSHGQNEEAFLSKQHF